MRKVIFCLGCAALLAGQALATQGMAASGSVERLGSAVGETEEVGTAGVLALFAALAAGIVIAVEASEDDEPVSP